MVRALLSAVSQPESPASHAPARDQGSPSSVLGTYRYHRALEPRQPRHRDWNLIRRRFRVPTELTMTARILLYWCWHFCTIDLVPG